MARIIVVDDERQLRSLVARALEIDGHQVLGAPDGRRALQLVAAHKIDVVITDILMPNKEGLETIAELSRTRPEIKIIAISGGSRMRNPQFLEVAKRLGAHAVLSKPFRIKELQDSITACLGMAVPQPQA